MTYAANGLIEASDYNGFVATNTPNFNGIWSTGAGNSGYGQTALATKTSGNLILAADWSNLLSNIIKSASHQGTTLSSFRDSSPSSSELILYESNLSNNINLINTNRLNAAAQGSTSSTSATNSTTWNDSLTISFIVTFANDNSARYFFNAGGQIGFTFSHPAGGGFSINQLISDLCNDVGTLWFSSTTSGTITLSGSSYSGVTKVGGQSNGPTVIYSNNGFYSLYPTGTNVLLLQYSEYVYHSYGSTFLRISGSYNGTGVITFTCLIDEVPNGATVSSGTAGNLTIRPPSTTQLNNTWGTPTVTTSVIPV